MILVKLRYNAGQLCIVLNGLIIMVRLANIVMPANTTFTTEYKPDLLNGIETIHAEVPASQD